MHRSLFINVSGFGVVEGESVEEEEEEEEVEEEDTVVAIEKNIYK